MNTEQIVSEEKQRLISLLFSCGLPEEKINALATIIDNTAWMKAKLIETREMIANTAVAIPYDNGGGQVGIRENPLFKGYHSLWKSYLAGMGKIFDYVPEEQAKVEEEEKQDNVLQMIRKKRRQA